MNRNENKEIRMLCIGMGKHFMASHFPIFCELKQKYQIKILGCVETEVRSRSIYKEIKQNFQEEIQFFTVNKSGVDISLKKKLDIFIDEFDVNVVTISVPPEIQFEYLQWLSHKKINVLCEKPFHIKEQCGVSVENSNIMYEETMRLCDMCSNLNKIALFTQRRKNVAYEVLGNYIEQISRYTGCPITNITVFHNDGQFFFPDEYFNESYHGYRLGYGKLAHSGYHLIDMCVQLLKKSISSYEQINKVKIQVSVTRPRDMVSLLSDCVLKDFFMEQNQESIAVYDKSMERLISYGEVDVHIIYTFFNDEIVISTQQLCLLHSGLSQRNPEDIEQFKINSKGRIKQEEVSVCIGPFFYGRLYKNRGEKRNTNLITYKTNLELQYNEYIKRKLNLLDENLVFYNSSSDVTDDRLSLVDSFFDAVINEKSEFDSSLSSHLSSIKLFSLTYKAMAMKMEGDEKSLVTTFSLK